MRADHFDVIAKAPPETSADMQRLMLQSLLAQCFHLSVHIEQKRMRVFALTVGKNGPKLRPTAEAGEAACHQQIVDHATAYQTFTCRSVSLAFLAERLGDLGNFTLPAVDATGLTGSYDIDFDYPTRLAPRC